MADESDILKDPTAHLERALHQTQPTIEAVNRFLELHRHLLAGGRPPKQWCGTGTAVGKLLEDADNNIEVFSAMAEEDGLDAECWQDNADMTIAARNAVTGEG